MEVEGKEENIKTMKLYSHVDRVYNELRAAGVKPGGSIDVEVLSKFDSYHYYGTQAIDAGIAALDIKPNSTVFDVGSGLGGPARYMAHKCKCHVIAVELQGDLDQTAKDLTRQCGLSDNVRHIHGDFLKGGLGIVDGSVDFLVSWLVFLHINDKDNLFQKCREVLKPGGKMYIEDYFLLKVPTEAEKEELRVELYIDQLDLQTDYVQHIEKAGFTDVKFEDITKEWTEFVGERYRSHVESRERYTKVHNEEIFNDQKHFFGAVNKLFHGGNLGGCRIIATAAE